MATKQTEVQPDTSSENEKNEKTPTSSISSKPLLLACLIIAAIVVVCIIGGAIAVFFGWKYIQPVLLKQFRGTEKKTVVERMISPTPSIPLTPSISISSTPSIPLQIPATGSSTPSVAATQSSFIIPGSDTRALVRADVTGLSPWQLKVARNEIYARHGRPFVHKDLACYFERMSWYVKDPAYTDARLTTIDQKNAVYILNYEKEIGSPLTDKDSGCGAF